MSWAKRKEIKALSEHELNRLIESNDTVFLLQNAGAATQQTQDSLIKFSQIIGVGIKSSFEVSSSASLMDLKAWMDNANDFILGYFGYDLKNRLENLKSQNPDAIGFSQAYFVIPETVIIVNEGKIQCFSETQKQPFAALPKHDTKSVSPSFESRPKQDYLNAVNELKNHIQQGDIYEANFCVQHRLKDAEVAPFELFQQLQKSSPAPFSCYVAHKGRFLMSSSPERFMMKKGNRIISQPMKGTNRRTSDNSAQKAVLRNDAKEVAENVMITDLVRNDLSKSAKKGTVKVDELCGVYEFEHVNQMISTVSAELRADVHPLDALLNAFPMGSMTGAPKIRAMELIDQYEDFSRGLYSGAVGYFTPNLDFDFNVVIRSILYDEEEKVVTFPTGSAITINSDPEKEYEECMLKAEAMRTVLMNHARKS